MTNYEELRQQCYQSINKNLMENTGKEEIRTWILQFEMNGQEHFDNGKKCSYFRHTVSARTQKEAFGILENMIRHIPAGLKLNLGCGGNILPGFVNIDHDCVLCDIDNQDCKPDIIMDIGKDIYPFDDGSVDIIWARNEITS